MKLKVTFFSLFLTLTLSSYLVVQLNGCGRVEGSGEDIFVNANKDNLKANEDKLQDHLAFLGTTVESHSGNVQNSADPSVPEMPMNVAAGEVDIQTFDENWTERVDYNGDPLPETIIGSQMTTQEDLIQIFDDNFVGSFDAHGNPLPEVIIGG
ncbi:MAG: hypothetical protein HY203_09350 [Nitrospirae bacterium]|nr:hypothetical protein [Nitrospirota bacterium]